MEVTGNMAWIRVWQDQVIELSLDRIACRMINGKCRILFALILLVMGLTKMGCVMYELLTAYSKQRYWINEKMWIEKWHMQSIECVKKSAGFKNKESLSKMLCYFAYCPAVHNFAEFQVYFSFYMSVPYWMHAIKTYNPQSYPIFHGVLAEREYGSLIMLVSQTSVSCII
jgi:hypothetical protein